MTTKEELIDEMEGIQRELQGYVDELMDEVMDEVEDAIEEAVENDNISLKRLQEIRDTLRELKSTDINDNTRELMIKHLEDIVEAGIKTKGHKQK